MRGSAWVVSMALVPASASAHVALVEPMARYSQDFQKDGPCGHPDNPAGEVVASFSPGDTITVIWNEFVPHPGHFRLALSAEGDGAFVDPISYTDFYSAPNVLLDDIEDPDGVMVHQIQLTLPEDVTCEECVLQLIQVMTDKPPWGPEGGNELYYQCADIRIAPGAGAVDETGGESGDGSESGTDGGATSTTGAPVDDESGGCAVGYRPPAGGAAAALLLLLGWRRRPRDVNRARSGPG